jgi:hypothetical protein
MYRRPSKPEAEDRDGYALAARGSSFPGVGAVQQTAQTGIDDIGPGDAVENHRVDASLGRN